MMLNNDRMLPDIVTLYNYISEDEATYKAKYKPTILYNVKYSYEEGVTLGDNSPSDASKIHFFDFRSSAYDEYGGIVHFIPYIEWLNKTDKTGYFTFATDGKDYIIRGEAITDISKISKAHEYFKVQKVQRLKAGNPRMWHWKVLGK